MDERAPFVGRTEAFGALQSVVGAARAGRSASAVVVGEPGIGKTRLLDELCSEAGAGGCTVLRGECDEAVAGASHVALGRAIEKHVRSLAPAQRTRDFGDRIGVLARIAPTLTGIVPDTADLAPLAPDEERRRLVDAVVHVVSGAARRGPVLVVIDDAQWADRGTLGLLHHLSTATGVGGVGVIVATRPDALESGHDASDGLRRLRGEPGAPSIALEGLDASDVATLAEARLGGPVDSDLVDALVSETNGNPFFVGELLAHLTENDRLRHSGGQWSLDGDRLGVPVGVRAVVSHRVGRLSDAAQQLLEVASAFDGSFPLAVVASLTGLEEAAALDALDETIAAGLVEHSAGVDTYDFTHALIRHALVDEQLSARVVRLRRRIAETLADDSVPRLDPVDPATIALQYARSAVLPGAEAGVDWALLAADRAERALGYAEAARLVGLALELALGDDPRRPALLARRAILQAYGGDTGAAAAHTPEAAAAVRAAEGDAAAVDFLDEAATALQRMGDERACWDIATLGLELAGATRSVAWARLTVIDQRRRMARDPLALATEPEAVWVELKRLLLPLPPSERVLFLPAWSSRDEALAAEGESTSIRFYTCGELRSTLPVALAEMHKAREAGAVGLSVGWAGSAVRAHVALGHLEAARRLIDEIDPLAFQFSGPMPFFVIWLGGRDELRLATNEGWDTALADLVGLGAASRDENAWAAAPLLAAAARIFAMLGDEAAALGMLEQVLPLVEALPGWAMNYVRMIADAAHVLWILGDHGYGELIAHHLREKVIAPDFRFPMFDARLSLARLATLDGDRDAALEWFASSRAVLDEQGAAPLRAICDLDEAMARLRFGDHAAAATLHEAALQQFRRLKMTGWERAALQSG